LKFFCISPFLGLLAAVRVTPAMSHTAAISVLVIVLMFKSSECNINKTKLLIGQLESKSSEKETTLGIKLAYNVSKNSTELKDFLEKYEIEFERWDTHVSWFIGINLHH